VIILSRNEKKVKVNFIERFKMSILQTAKKPASRAPIMTITGDAGMGKTSLAATFPNPVFIRGEDGIQSISKENRPDAFPVLTEVDQLWEQLLALRNETHQYKTIVIDSVTAIDTLFTNYIVDTDIKKPKTIAQALGGYGAGFQALSSLHGRIRRICGDINDKGINVIFIAHSETENIELPDEDAYTRYGIRINKKSLSHYIDNVDLVGFIKLETITRGDGDRKKAISDGTRQIICYATPANISKNRYGIEEKIIIEKNKNPFVGLMPIAGLKQTKQQATIEDKANG